MGDHHDVSSHQTDRRRPVLRDGTQSNKKAEEQMESKETVDKKEKVKAN